MGHPTIYPTGATIYDPEKAYSGYTVFQAVGKGALLIDMNGREVRLWRGLQGFPNKIFPGGYILGSTGRRNRKYGVQDQLDVVQLDWDGNEVWRFDHHQYVEDPDETPRWMARQHHDFQREGSSVGYYAPGQQPNSLGGKNLILVHENIVNAQISDKPLLEDVFLEVDWEGNVLWKWYPNEHFNELGFSEAAKNVLFREPNLRFAESQAGDWLHINCVSWVGPNKWYDAGDERFHPDNIIWDAREANIIAITSRQTGEIVWKIGPDYDTPETKHLGPIIGQHHAHIIPRGLPGEGNLLVFDNGGWGGYGLPNPASPFGLKAAVRDYSRILEIDPLTLDIQWQYTAEEAGFIAPMDSSRFYSPYISSAQRLPNGNTLIDQGSDGRIFEVTAKHETVWEYISPYMDKSPKTNNMVYRAYRVPYNWIPQLERPEEVRITPLDVTTFRVPGSAPLGGAAEITVAGVEPQADTGIDFCVAAKGEARNHDALFDVDRAKYQIISKFDMSMIEGCSAVYIFGAKWCAKCKLTLEQLGTLPTGNIPLKYLDTEDHPEIAEALEIQSLPTILAIKNGNIAGRHVGAATADELQALIDSVKD